jgi:hypothetical protein
MAELSLGGLGCHWNADNRWKAFAVEKKHLSFSNLEFDPSSSIQAQLDPFSCSSTELVSIQFLYQVCLCSLFEPWVKDCVFLRGFVEGRAYADDKGTLRLRGY